MKYFYRYALLCLLLWTFLQVNAQSKWTKKTTRETTFATLKNGNLYTSPLVADLQVDEQKFTYTDTFIIEHCKHRDIKKCNSKAYLSAIQLHNADVIIMPNLSHVLKQEDSITTYIPTITGYAAHYGNFRAATTKDSVLLWPHKAGTYKATRLSDFQESEKVKKTKEKTSAPIQSKHDVFSIHLGIGTCGLRPTYNYYNYNNSEALIKEQGFDGSSISYNLGIKGKIPTPAKGLGVTISGDLFYNYANKTNQRCANDWQTIAMDYLTDATASMKLPHHFNGAFLAGLNYLYDFTPNIGLWTEASAGVNMCYRTPYTSTLRYVTYINNNQYLPAWRTEKNTIKYDFFASFAWQVGVGVTLSQRFSIGFHYYGLGPRNGKRGTKTSIIDQQANNVIDAGNYYSKDKSTVYLDRYDIRYRTFMLRLGIHF